MCHHLTSELLTLTACYLFNSLQAQEKCFQNLHYVERHEDHTIAHAIQTSYKKTKVCNHIATFSTSYEKWTIKIKESG